VEGVAFGTDGTFVAGGALWSLATGERVLDLDCGEPKAIALSPDNQMLATASIYSGSGQTRKWNPAVRLWNLTTGKHIRDLDTVAKARLMVTTFQSLAFSPDGGLLAAACDEWVRLFNPTTGEPVRRIGDGGADAVAFHPHGSLLVTARRDGRVDAGVRLWNPATGKHIRDLDTGANAVAFSPDGAILATASAHDGVVRLWNIANTG
jgi:WD40 repeat protein